MDTQTDRPIGIGLAGVVLAIGGAIVMSVAAADQLLAGAGLAVALAAGMAAIVAVQILE